MNLVSGRLGCSGSTVKSFGCVEIFVAEYYLLRFGWNTGVDQTLGATAAKVVGAGVFQSATGFFIGLLDDDSDLFPDQGDDAAYAVFGQSSV